MTTADPLPELPKGLPGMWIQGHAETAPAKSALHFGRQSFTYGDMGERILRLGHGLRQKLGLVRGDRIAYLGHNHPDLLTLIFAASRLGLVVVPLNWRLAPPELQAIIADAAPRALLAEEPFADVVERLRDQERPWQLIARDFEREGWRSFPDLLEEGSESGSSGQAGDPLLIVYTSGTTGRAKGAVLTQDALRWNAANSVDMHGLQPDDRVLTALPLFHVGGLNIQTLPALAVGAEVRLETRFDPEAVLRRIADDRPTLTVLVPAMMKALISDPRFPDTDLSSLRQITTGSSIVPESLIEAFHKRGIPVTQVYGTTETAPIAVYQRVHEAFQSVGSAGRVARHGKMRIVDDDGAEAGPGEPGEIQIRGPQVMTGYRNQPEATDAAFDQGWFRTGDIGRQDRDGRLWVEARVDDLIKSGGERIYPAEIEALLSELPEVRDVAVVGRADPDWGEVPVAFVQLAPGASGDGAAMLRKLDGRLARYKRPKDVLLVDDLPRSALGKVLRYRLRARFEAD